MKNQSNKKILFISFILLLLCCSGCLNITMIITNQKRILLFGEFIGRRIYPLGITNDNYYTIIPNIFNGLVQFDEDFRIVPTLAVSWNNPNNLTWRFYLRQGVKFHNGDDFTAEDVRFSFENMSSTSFDSIIKDIIVLDNYTIEFNTFDTKSWSSFTVSDTKASFFVRNITEQPEEHRLIGTGAYRLADYELNTSTTLERFDEYWGEKPDN